MVADKETRRRFPDEVNIAGVIRERCRGKGLFMLTLGKYEVDVMLITLPLIITKEEVDGCFTLIWSQSH